MSSKAPSGGTKEIVRSFSNRDRRTHWWNFTSSRSTAFELDPKIIGQKCGNQKITKVKGQRSKGHRWLHLLPVLSKRTLSLSPSRSSGIPVSSTRILITPHISLSRVLPLAFTCQTHRQTDTLHTRIQIERCWHTASVCEYAAKCIPTG